MLLNLALLSFQGFDVFEATEVRTPRHPRHFLRCGGEMSGPLHKSKAAQTAPPDFIKDKRCPSRLRLPLRCSKLKILTFSERTLRKRSQGQGSAGKVLI